MAQREQRSYGQYCGLARALDVVGDRWGLLVIRELLLGPRRYGELQAGLPGIASNLLANRLSQMEKDGLVARSLGEPRSGVRYALTPRGEALRETIEALIRWSTPLMVQGRAGQVVRAQWLAVALPALLGARPRRRIRVLLTTCGEDLLLTAGPRGVSVTSGRGEAADAEVIAEPELLLGLAAGRLDLGSAEQLGAAIKGDRPALTSVFHGASGPSP